MSGREQKIFMTAFELLIVEGLTIEMGTMRDFFVPVLYSMVRYNQQEGSEGDKAVSMVLSVLIEVDKVDREVVYHGFRKAHVRNLAVSRVAIGKKNKLMKIMPSEYFDSILSRAIFARYRS